MYELLILLMRFEIQLKTFGAKKIDGKLFVCYGGGKHMGDIVGGKEY